MTGRVLAVLACALAGGSARAEEGGPGTTAVPALQVPLSARAAGMGGAFTAVADDASALFYNPAGLARLGAQELGLSFASGAGETSLQNLAYAGPTPFAGVTGNGFTGAGVNLLYSNSGTLELNRLNPDGSLGSSEKLSAGSDLVFSGAYAERAGSTPVEVRGASYQIDHYLGVGGKYVRSTVVTYSASAYAADVGYLAHSPEAGWSVGVSAANLGGRIRYSEASEPLPATARGGLAWQGASGEGRILAALDGDYILDERLWHANAGVEYLWMKTYAARAGYQFRRDEAGLTIGLGARWRNRFLVDYAWGLGRELGRAHRVTLSYRFGDVSSARRGRQRRPFIEFIPEREQLRGIEDRKPEFLEPAPRPRPTPRERPQGQGAPGWIY